MGIGDFANKAKDAMNSEQGQQGMDKAREFAASQKGQQTLDQAQERVNSSTGNKFEGQVEQGRTAVDGFVGGNQNEQDQQNR